MLSLPLNFGNRPIGGMYLYESAQVQNILTVNEYHAVEGLLATSILTGLSYLASAWGTITNTANNGGLLRCTDALHGLTSGQYVTLIGMGDVLHNGVTRVTVVDVNTFDTTILFSSIGDTGNWARGSALTVLPGFDANAKISFSCSISSAGNNKNYKFEVFLNDTEIDEFVAERRLAVANDLGPIPAAGPWPLAAGDVIWLAAEGITDTTNYTMRHANINIFS